MNLIGSSRWAACVSVGLGCMVAYASPARGQTFIELGGGWNYLAPAAAPQDGSYSRGVNGRASIGRAFASNFRMRLDVIGMQFGHNVQYFPPCASPGCTNTYYSHQSNGVVGVVANGLVNIDPRGILYIVGGPGIYDALVPSSELHVGLSVGAGISVPVGAGLRAFAEAGWHELLGRTVGPSRLAPITLGLRY